MDGIYTSIKYYSYVSYGKDVTLVDSFYICTPFEYLCFYRNDS